MESECCPPLTCTVLDEQQATAMAARLKALADPVRLRLVSLLACSDTGELCACDLPDLLDRKQPTVSHHLKILTEAGLVAREQRGKWAWFRLVPDGLAELRIALGGVADTDTETDRDEEVECGGEVGATREVLTTY